jgi:hypothetical protein
MEVPNTVAGIAIWIGEYEPRFLQNAIRGCRHDPILVNSASVCLLISSSVRNPAGSRKSDRSFRQNLDLDQTSPPD